LREADAFQKVSLSTRRPVYYDPFSSFGPCYDSGKASATLEDTQLLSEQVPPGCTLDYRPEHPPGGDHFAFHFLAAYARDHPDLSPASPLEASLQGSSSTSDAAEIGQAGAGERAGLRRRLGAALTGWLADFLGKSTMRTSAWCLLLFGALLCGASCRAVANWRSRLAGLTAPPAPGRTWRVHRLVAEFSRQLFGRSNKEGFAEKNAQNSCLYFLFRRYPAASVIGTLSILGTRFYFSKYKCVGYSRGPGSTHPPCWRPTTCAGMKAAATAHLGAQIPTSRKLPPCDATTIDGKTVVYCTRRPLNLDPNNVNGPTTRYPRIFYNKFDATCLAGACVLRDMRLRRQGGASTRPASPDALGAVHSAEAASAAELGMQIPQTQSIVVQVGQCGNQIGSRFWDLALREHASVSRRGDFDDSLGTFFRQQPGEGQALKARAVLVDMEEGVVGELLKGRLRGVFDHSALITDVSGSGNNWGCRALRIRPQARGRPSESHSEMGAACLAVRHSLQRLGTGWPGTPSSAAAGASIPEVYRFVTAVYPSEDDDVITSPYNSVLAMRCLTDYADWRYAHRQCLSGWHRASGCRTLGPHRCRSSAAAGAAAKALTSTPTPTLSRRTPRPFDAMNSIVANLLLNLTASARFSGTLNVDLNEISMNLVPFPRLHYCWAAQSPLSPPCRPGGRIRHSTSRSGKEDSVVLGRAAIASLPGLRPPAAGRIDLSDVRRCVDRLEIGWHSRTGMPGDCWIDRALRRAPGWAGSLRAAQSGQQHCHWGQPAPAARGQVQPAL
uniref:Tubulin domain-containing protein n=1 Tax=Macrostomum lignano TaxID=282301 RepID=A0A1I8FLX4_9PLAT